MIITALQHLQTIRATSRTGVVLTMKMVRGKRVLIAEVIQTVGVNITVVKRTVTAIVQDTLKQTKTLAYFAKVFIVRRQIMENNKLNCKITEKELIHFSRREISKKIAKDSSLFFEINMDEVADVNFVMKNIIEILKIANMNNISFVRNESGEIKHNFLIKNNDNYEKIELLERLFNVLKFKSFKQIYSYIYDSICDDLDKKFEQNNYCDFKNDKCIAQRTVKTAHKTMGCCYMHTYSKIMSMPISLGLCKYLQDKKCSKKCITCKFFTCKYLKKKGIVFRLEDYEIFKYFFNRKQKRIINESFFKTKEEIIDLLIKNL